MSTSRTFPAAAAASTCTDLSAAGVRSWVIGGWGVDALLGRTTREHHDLDLLVDVDDLPALDAWLRAGGFEHRYDWPESRSVHVEGRAWSTAYVAAHADGRELDVHAVEVRADGGCRLATDDPWSLPEGALTGTGTIDGVVVACASRAAQVAMHSGYDLPPQHLADLAALPTYATCVVMMLGYPGMGKRTTGAALADLLDGVLVDNALINRPVLELWRWDGVAQLPPQIWDRVVPIRDAVLGTIEDLAPASNSYVFTNVIHDDPESLDGYESIRSLAHRRGSLFLAVMLTCDIDEQVSRIDNPDRIERRKGSDPEAYRRHRLETVLHQPPPAEVIHLDTTSTPAVVNAALVLAALLARGFRPAG